MVNFGGLFPLSVAAHSKFPPSRPAGGCRAPVLPTHTQRAGAKKATFACGSLWPKDAIHLPHQMSFPNMREPRRISLIGGAPGHNYIILCC